MAAQESQVLFSSSLCPPRRLPSQRLGVYTARVWSNEVAVGAYPARRTCSKVPLSDGPAKRGLQTRGCARHASGVLSREPQSEEYPISTAVAPGAVFTVRTYRIGHLYNPGLVRKSGHPATRFPKSASGHLVYVTLFRCLSGNRIESGSRKFIRSIKRC